ncbi:protein ETHYLENE-INSENSITIVE 2 isoform X2 [Asparagus officinalis]|uniref:protein ETHYLENE-INSENSITIVE 2 isoform X2 n=1 Tax=Asparagus officinalis TaxID=4686 RepID=UPI00098E1A4D|nr:protein ETHYLENE-INSENSITIVE 2 isoform X2 [Asparagus officinalis]
MASQASGGMMSHLFPSLGPALMISMGYIDLGKWVAAVEGGARFGFDLVFVVMLFNCFAILCQYLSTCIGTATGKNLAEICSEEYCRFTCMSLGVQAELSMIISDITMILGIGHGLGLLFGMDLYASIFYATIGIVLLPLFLALLDNFKAEALYIGIAAFALLFYVLGVLISQPEVPLMTSGIFPKLSGESAYSLMALLGANIMVHNFYIHSSIVKKRQQNVAIGALFHDHFFAILFIFTGIFLANYVLMNSAAAVLGSTDVAFSFPDVSMLMDQIFRSPVAPLAFFLVLFFSSQITALTRNIGRQVIFPCFFGINLSEVHHAIVKIIMIIPALYCAKSAGAEGIYQLLILCQVILAMLLPSSVIPLFRVASSRFVMRAFKISWHLEILSLVAFLVMFASNIFFVIEMLFGNNSWMINLMGSTENNLIISYSVLLIACASIAFTLHLAVTPLKSASNRPEADIWTGTLQKDQSELLEDAEDNNVDVDKYDENQESIVENAFEKSAESQYEKSMLDSNPDLPETAIDSDHESHHSTQSSSITVASMPLKSDQEEPKSAVEVDLLDTADKASVGCLLSANSYERIDYREPSLKDEGSLTYIPKDRESEGFTVDAEESFKGFPLSSTPEVLESFNSVKSKGLDGLNGSGSLSRLSGLGRAARRQLASVLDEFWGNLFDFHGKLTQEAVTNRLDVLLGLGSDLRPVGSAVKSDAIGTEASKNFFPDTDMGSTFPTTTRDYGSQIQMKNHNVDLPFGVQMGSSSWSQNMQPLTSHVQSSSNNLVDPSERLYSSLRLPQYSDNKDHQPATIHGYQMASYLRELGATRAPYSSTISQNLPPTPNSASSMSALRDQILYNHAQNELGALGTSSLQNPVLSSMNRLQTAATYYESSFGEASDSVNSSAYTKKYHSSPDISAIIALGRNAYLNEAKRGAPIGPRPSSGRWASDQSQYLNPASRAGVPLAFDQLSPPKMHRDIFGLNPDTKSLWSRQPFEQFFGVAGKSQMGSDGAFGRSSIPPKETFPYAESGAKLLLSLRVCIMKLLKLEGSEWLFKQNGGFDEELIDQIASSEKYRADKEDVDISCFQSIPSCGDACVWQVALIVSFGVWCIRRILELSLVESRPELWGKYTYVLNRLQGIIEPAFSKPRQPLPPCFCVEKATEAARNFTASSQNGFLRSTEKPPSKPLTSTSMVLEIIKDVEIAVSGRKGRTGTAAGDVAFPKGKENLASVLKRYKRRLSNKSSGSHESPSSSRRIPSSSSSSVL